MRPHTLDDLLAAGRRYVAEHGAIHGIDTWHAWALQERAAGRDAPSRSAINRLVGGMEALAGALGAPYSSRTPNVLTDKVRERLIAAGRQYAAEHGGCLNGRPLWIAWCKGRDVPAVTTLNRHFGTMAQFAVACGAAYQPEHRAVHTDDTKARLIAAGRRYAAEHGGALNGMRAWLSWCKGRDVPVFSTLREHFANMEGFAAACSVPLVRLLSNGSAQIAPEPKAAPRVPKSTVKTQPKPAPKPKPSRAPARRPVGLVQPPHMLNGLTREQYISRHMARFLEIAMERRLVEGY